jgi:hypothetical protein
MDIEKIEIVPDFEAERFPKMAHIRFDCVITMFDQEKVKTDGTFFGRREKPRKPNWLKSESKMTLEFVKLSSEYEIGRQIKEQFEQLERHINALYNSK